MSWIHSLESSRTKRVAGMRTFLGARTLLWLAALGTPFVAGCFMHPLGHGHPRAREPGTAIVKEVQGEATTVTLEIPPLDAGKEATLTVRVRDNRTGEPVSGAKVALTIAAPGPRGRVAEQDAAGSTTHVAPAESPKGVYRVTHEFESAGPYEILVEVHARAEAMHEFPIIVSARADVGMPAERGVRASTLPMLVIGGIGMAAMMVIMLAR
jgi:hypothetical protein